MARRIARLRAAWQRLRGIGGGQRRDDDLAAEIESHLALHTDELVRQGVPQPEARRLAMLRIGGIEPVKEAYRDRRGVPLVDAVRQDLRYAFRVLRRSPGFTIAATLTLALGIGANTAIFTIVDAVLIRSLPVRAPDRLVVIERVTSRGERQNSSYLFFERIRDQHEIFTGVLAAQDGFFRMPLALAGEPAASSEARVQLVSGEYFDVLGVHPYAGRLLSAADNREGQPAVAVLSASFWRTRFLADPGIIGRDITLRNQSLTIVGVAPPGFFGEAVGRAPDVWVPVVMQPRFTRAASLLTDPNTGWLQIVARLRDDVTAAQAAAGLDVWLKSIQTEASPVGKASRPFMRFAVEDGARGLSGFRQQFSLPLRILAGIVCLVLLIACANVANLLLARATAREREVAVRLAIGAGPWRLVAQFLTESVVLAVLGGVLGLLFAVWGSQLLVALAARESQSIALDVAPSLRMLGFTLLVSVATVLVFGLVPALLASRVSVGTTLRPSGGTSSRVRLTRGLIAAQIAITIVLVSGGVLFARTLHNLRSRDLGFDETRLVQGRVDIRAAGYTNDQIAPLSQRILDRLQSLPGVQAATMSHAGFGTGLSRTCCLAVEGYTPAAGEDRQVRMTGVGPAYFSTIGLRLVLGRDFTANDVSADAGRSPAVAIVNEAFVRRYFGQEAPLGRRYGWGDPPRVRYETEIVGVVKDSVTGDPRQDALPLVYLPSAQGIMYSLRAAASPEAVIAGAMRAVHEIDPTIESAFRSVASEMDRMLVRETLLARVSLGFGVLASLLAGIGVYGVMAYTVSRRTREIGIRMALGADSRSVRRTEMRTALALAAMGAAAGVPASFAAARAVQHQLYGITAGDPWTPGVAVAVLALVAAAAAYLPARRASRVDPMTALRVE